MNSDAGENDDNDDDDLVDDNLFNAINDALDCNSSPPAVQKTWTGRRLNSSSIFIFIFKAVETIW